MISYDWNVDYLITYSKYNDLIEEASENINFELIMGKLDSNMPTLKTKSTQNTLLEKAVSVKPIEEEKMPLDNIDECKEEGKLILRFYQFRI